MAGIRLGIGLASVEIIEILNKIKPPYNVNTLTQKKALELLSCEETYQEKINILLEERNSMLNELKGLSFVKKVFPSQANFILVRVENANILYNFLIDNGIVIRNRTTVTLLENCLRISLGTPEENQQLFEALRKFQDQ